MSLISMSTVGIQRDLAPPGRRDTFSVGGFGQLLVAQIPSEALLAYGTLLAIFGVGGSDYKIGRWVLYGVVVAVCPAVVVTTYLAKRTYGFDDPPPKKPAPPIVINPLDIVSPASDAEVGATPDPKRRGNPHLPILPALAAAAAMAVYGLTIPGSALQYSVSNTGFGIIAGCLAVGGGLMMSILAPFLGQANNARVASPPDAV
jgi:hypothetical protein